MFNLYRTIKGKSVSEFTDIARHVDWIREVIAESDTPTFGEVYSDWSEWSECDKFCDGGIQTRERNCSRVDYCQSPSEMERRVCNTIKCQTLFGFRSAAGYKSGKGAIFPDYINLIILANNFNRDWGPLNPVF